VTKVFFEIVFGVRIWRRGFKIKFWNFTTIVTLSDPDSYREKAFENENLFFWNLEFKKIGVLIRSYSCCPLYLLW